MEEIVREIKKIMIDRNLTLSTIESCTGGGIANALTSIEGASKFFYGSMVTYATNCKINQLGVDPELIEIYDVVSDKVALDMATQGLHFFKTSYIISITGYIGKTGKFPGTVWICIKGIEDKKYTLIHLTLSGDRLKLKNYCIKRALEVFLKVLKK